MSASFLHGVETIEVDTAGRSYTVVKSGVIAILGIAPQSAKNTLILCTSENDFAQFGSSIPGFTIPQALEVIADQGAATVLVVNVFDPTAHTTAVTAEAQTVHSGKLKLAYAPIGVVTVLDSAGTATAYVLGTDYQIDAYGNFTVLGNGIADNTALKFTYKKLNLSAVNSSVIIGTQDGDTGDRTGSRCLELAFNTYGFNPKIIIAPGFSTLTAVASQLTALAIKYRGITYIDAPAGIAVSTAITGRGPAGTIGFNVSDTRTELLYPQLLKYDTASDSDVAFPYSAFLAGIRQAVDNDDENGGFWVSSSNQPINCQGVEVAISASLNDPTADNQILNAAGITTVFNAYGTGILTYGNRNSTYPGVSGPKTFTNISRIDDIVSESMELAAFPYVDKGITQAFIDVAREEGNSFIRTLIARGALLPGSTIVYNPDDNPADELANGHVVFERIYMGPTPAERITFQSIMDVSLIANLK